MPNGFVSIAAQLEIAANRIAVRIVPCAELSECIRNWNAAGKGVLEFFGFHGMARAWSALGIIVGGGER